MFPSNNKRERIMSCRRFVIRLAGGIPVARVACSSPADALCNRFGVLCSPSFFFFLNRKKRMSRGKEFVEVEIMSSEA